MSKFFTFYHFDFDPRFPPFLLYVRWKSGVTFVRRCFHDDGKSIPPFMELTRAVADMVLFIIVQKKELYGHICNVIDLFTSMKIIKDKCISIHVAKVHFERKHIIEFLLSFHVLSLFRKNIFVSFIQELVLILFCSHKVGDIRTLQFIALTKTMKHNII